MEPPTKRKKENEEIFGGLFVYILQTGIGKARSTIFKKQIEQNGGKISENYDKCDNVSHIIVDENMDYSKLLRILKKESVPEKTCIVKSIWLSNCIKQKKILPTTEFELQRKIDSKKATERTTTKEKLLKLLETNPTNLSSTSPAKKQVERDERGKTETVNEEKNVTEDPQKPELPKAGVMWHTSNKFKDDSDPESDYEPSDTEENEAQPSTSIVENETSKKILSVSSLLLILVLKYQYLL